MATLSIDNAPKVVLKENDNIDNKDNKLIKKVVSRCHSLLSEKKALIKVLSGLAKPLKTMFLPKKEVSYSSLRLRATA